MGKNKQTAGWVIKKKNLFCLYFYLNFFKVNRPPYRVSDGQQRVLKVFTIFLFSSGYWLVFFFIYDLPVINYKYVWIGLDWGGSIFYFHLKQADASSCNLAFKWKWNYNNKNKDIVFSNKRNKSVLEL